MTLIDTLRWLVDIDSETGQESEICSAIAHRLAHLPQVRVGDSLVVGTRGERPVVVLAGHLDTVPRQGQGPATITGDRLFGLGSSDMKAGLAVMIHLLEDPPKGSHDLVGVFYAAEEGPIDDNELLGVLDEVAWLREADFAILLEPSDNQVQLGCNGVVNARVVFEGKASHSARPWWGENAVTKAGEWLSHMHTLEPRDHVLGGLTFRRTISVTRAAGGVANNVIPGRFELNVNMRFPPDMSLDEAIAELEEVCAAADRFEVADTAPAGRVEADHPLLQRLIEVSGAEPAAKQGWTDVARFSEVGIPAVNYGPGEAALAHQADESVPLANLEQAWVSLRRVLTG